MARLCSVSPSQVVGVYSGSQTPYSRLNVVPRPMLTGEVQLVAVNRVLISSTRQSGGRLWLQQSLLELYIDNLALQISQRRPSPNCWFGFVINTSQGFSLIIGRDERSEQNLKCPCRTAKLTDTGLCYRFIYIESRSFVLKNENKIKR